MGTLAKFAQDPDEVKRYTISWEDWLDSGEHLTGVVFEVTIANGDKDSVMMEVVADAIATDGAAVSFMLRNGAANVTYKITMRVNTSTLQVKEDCILVAVRNC